MAEEKAHLIFAEELMEIYHTVILDGKSIYGYDDLGKYVECEFMLKREIAEKLGIEDFTNNKMKETIEFIRHRSPDATETLNPESHLNLKNGCLNLETMKLEPHDPKLVYTWQYDVEYSPDAKAEKIDAFVRSIVEEKYHHLIFEIMAYCLIKRPFLQKSFFFYGEGSNGKTTLINLLIHFLGKENVTAIPLQELEKNRFAVSHLYGKLANVVSDMTPQDLKNVAMFKALTTGDKVGAEKKFGELFSFNAEAKLIFSANRLPIIYDNTQAFYRRLVIVTFPNCFIGKENKNLFSEITTPQEMSGLLNLLLAARANLLKNQRFTNEMGIKEIEALYERLSNSVAAFLQDCTEFSSDGYVAKETLYSAFKAYCAEQKVPLFTEHKFGALMKANPQIQEQRRSISGERKLVWAGINLVARESKEQAQENDGYGNSEGLDQYL